MGKLIVKLDFSANEVRCWGIISGDQVLCNLFVNGRWLRQQFRMTENPVFADLMDTVGDVHKVNCVAGDSWIATDKGVLRIDEMADISRGSMQRVNAWTTGRDGVARVSGWKFSGTRKLLGLTTEKGNRIKVTPEHRVQVFDPATGDTVWRRAQDCQLGDLLCFNTKPMVRTTKLKLNLAPYTPSKNGLHARPVRCPKRMTENLAFLVGAIVSEGMLHETDNAAIVSVTNSDRAYIDRVRDCLHSEFGLDLDVGISYCAGREHVIDGVLTRYTKDQYGVGIGSRQLMHYLKELGLYVQHGRREGKVASNFVHVPWSIMQADTKAQMAFLAAYIEGDGSVDDRIRICSQSDASLDGIRAILNAHGLIPRYEIQRTCKVLCLDRGDSTKLWSALSPYMITKRLQSEGVSREGIPTEFVRRALAARRVSKRHARFKNDAGHEETLSGWSNYSTKVKKLPYVSSWTGMRGFLDGVRRVSDSLADKIEDLQDKGYVFSPITVIESLPAEKVYDLQMVREADPSFTANGLIVHNCQFFFQVDPADVTKDQRNSVKSIVFGAIYGRGANAIAQQAKAAVDLIKELMGRFFARFKKASGWLDKAKRDAVTVGFSHGPSGRIRNSYCHLTGVDNMIAAAERRGANAPVQGFAADWGHMAAYLIELHIEKVCRKFGLDKKPIMEGGVGSFVHDAIKGVYPYRYVLVAAQIFQWATTIGVCQYYKTHFGVKYYVEPEVDVEFAAHDAEHYKWSYDETSLRKSIRQALEDQKTYCPTLDVDAAEREVWSVRDNPELVAYLDEHYPILSNWPDAKHLTPDEVKKVLQPAIDKQTRTVKMQGKEALDFMKQVKGMPEFIAKAIAKEDDKSKHAEMAKELAKKAIDKAKAVFAAEKRVKEEA